jgi:F0F1-type ATP synthase assembly protein I
MPSDNKPENPDSRKPTLQKVQSNSNQLAMAMEVPFTFVGAVVVGGLLGYFLDVWLHTSPWLMIVFGCFGFAAGILEIVRRFGPKDSGSGNDNPSS